MHLVLVLDRSGSMQKVHGDALGAVNSYIEAAKKDAALKSSCFSLITFSSESVDTIRRDLPIEEVKPVTVEEYRCSGWTPLYDAIGRGIELLDEAVGPNKHAKAALVIMTDGQENSSLEFNHDGINAMIEARKEQGWMLVFLGDGLNVAKQGAALGTTAANVASYLGGVGLRAAVGVVGQSLSSYASSKGWAGRLATANKGFTAEQRDELTRKEEKKAEGQLE